MTLPVLGRVPGAGERRGVSKPVPESSSLMGSTADQNPVCTISGLEGSQERVTHLGWGCEEASLGGDIEADPKDRFSRKSRVRREVGTARGSIYVFRGSLLVQCGHVGSDER